MTTITDTHTLHVHERAMQTMNAMREQCHAAQAFWGRIEPEKVQKMLLTCASQLGMLMSSPIGSTTTVTRDGELNLFVQTPHIVYGLIFHPSPRADAPKGEEDMQMVQHAPVLGRYCMSPLSLVAGEGMRYCLKPIYSGERTCDGHELLTCKAPVLGEWSFHS